MKIDTPIDHKKKVMDVISDCLTEFKDATGVKLTQINIEWFTNSHPSDDTEWAEIFNINFKAA